MQVIGIFVVCVVILDAVGVVVSSLVENYSPNASLLVFLGFYVVNFIIAWQVAVFLTEKFLVSDAQRKANEEHMDWVNSKFAGARK